METYLRKEARHHGSSLQIVDKKKLETVNLVNGMFDQIPVIQ